MSKTIYTNEAHEAHELHKFGRVRVAPYGNYGEKIERTAWADEEGRLWVQLYNCWVLTDGMEDMRPFGWVRTFAGGTCAK